MQKKGLVVLLIIILTFNFVGCAQSLNKSTMSQETTSAVDSQTTENTNSPTQDNTSVTEPVKEVKEVIDANGRSVTVPEKIDRIAITCNGGTTHEATIFGSGDKIVAQPSMKKFPQLLTMYPGFNSVVDPGSFDNVNIEEIIKANPDITLVGISSEKGNKLIEDAGFPTYTMLIGWAGIDTLKNEFTQVGTLLGNEDKANELIKYWNDKMAYVNDLVSKVPESEKKTVLYTNATLSSVHGKNVWGDSFITAAGGINAAAEIEDSKKASVEEIMGWNPDFIIIQKNGTALEDLKNDARISAMDAIKKGNVYQVPIGAFWWDRPSPESPLGFMWLATLLYPEYTKDIDLKKETKEFFKEFYNYDLSDEEYDSFF